MYLCPVRPTFAPSSLLLQYNSLSIGMSLTAVRQAENVPSAEIYISLVTVKILCLRCQHPDWTSSHLAETGEAASSAAFDSL